MEQERGKKKIYFRDKSAKEGCNGVIYPMDSFQLTEIEVRKFGFKRGERDTQYV